MPMPSVIHRLRAEDIDRFEASPHWGAIETACCGVRCDTLPDPDAVTNDASLATCSGSSGVAQMALPLPGSDIPPLTSRPTTPPQVPSTSRPVPPRSTTAANRVVAAYVDAGGRFHEARSRARLGRAARALMLTNSWSLETMIQAVQEFARTKRHPHFLNEWCSEHQTRLDDIERSMQKAAEAEPMAPDVAAVIGGVKLGRMT